MELPVPSRNITVKRKKSMRERTRVDGCPQGIQRKTLKPLNGMEQNDAHEGCKIWRES